MCFDKRVLAGLAVLGVGVLVFAPHLVGAALPLLLIAICPLSMLLMMRGMSGMSGGKDGSCSTNEGAGRKSTESQLAELRAEVERLRSEHALQGIRAPHDTSLN